MSATPCETAHRRTTIADPTAARAADLVHRQFAPPAPNRLWVADLTYVSTWSRFAYVAFVVDAYARRILGWRVAPTMATSMVLDAIEQAIWTRQQEGVLDFKDVVHHTDRGSQGSTRRSGSASDSRTPGSNRRSVPLRVLRRHPAHRTGDGLLRSTTKTSLRLSPQIGKSPDMPGRFSLDPRRKVRGTTRGRPQSVGDRSCGDTSSDSRSVEECPGSTSCGNAASNLANQP
jgi:hypothetical protein